MKVLSTTKRISKTPVKAVDCFVGEGYLKMEHGSLPDVDQDFQSDRRQDVKDYMERRYNHDGKQRVFSAGTFTTLKAKAVIKDVARTMRISPSLVNYLTAIFEDGEMEYTDIFKLAATNRKVAKFVADYPRLFEDIRALMFQPRSSSVHASALLVTPDEADGEDMECFDFVPVKKIDGVLVSENSGVELDQLGLLKNDCLATKELSKLHDTFQLVKEHYGRTVTLEELSRGGLDDPRVYQLFCDGHTQNIFQFSSKGITKTIMEIRPSRIEDLIAANALYRPATIGNGSVDAYINRKSGLVAPAYLWGTYDVLKKNYGVIIYQEDIVALARKIGGFSLKEGVNLAKCISKKKVDQIRAMKEKFFVGAKKQGCPQDDAVKIWEAIESAGLYCFNAAHATAYAVTAYVGAWLKANYPTAFYTVSLQWADDDELAPIMAEMEKCSKARVAPPDINHSGDSFFTDYERDLIFWSLSRIKMVGAKAVDWIMEERRKNGEFSGIVNFVERIFKYKLKKYQYWDDPENEEEIQRCPVNARHVRNLILAGCFDKVENASSVTERFAMLEKAARALGFEISPKEFPEELRGKHYFWSQQQIKVSGLGAIDYRRIYDNSEMKLKTKGRTAYRTIKETLDDSMDGKHAVVCATVADVEEKKFTSKKTGNMETFCKITLQQNNEITELVLWPEEYAKCRPLVQGCKDKILLASCWVKYSDFAGQNNLQLSRNNLIEIV